MSNQDAVGDLIADLLQAAVRTDGKGQLNVSKLLRASAHALAQSSAAVKGFPDDVDRLARDLRSLSDRLKATDLDPSVGDRVALGSELLAEGHQAGIEQFPDPYVCRRCGGLGCEAPTSSCPRCGAHALTFLRFAPAYWLTLYGPHEVLHRLVANPDLFQSAIGELPADRLDWAPTPGGWAAVDVLRHVRDADSVLAQRIDLLLDSDDPHLEFKPVFAWTNARTGEAGAADAILASYVASRRALVSRLRTIGHDDWQRTGVHEEFGRVTLLEQASYFAAHELTHLRQLEQIRRALAPT